jgi:hypothetical protein
MRALTLTHEWGTRRGPWRNRLILHSIGGHESKAAIYNPI